MKRKIKAIWYEIIQRWFLLTFFSERMERERLQVIADIVDKKDTLWKNIPSGHYNKARTLSEILQDSMSVLTKKEKDTHSLRKHVDNAKEEGVKGVILSREDTPEQAREKVLSYIEDLKQKENGEQQEKK